MDLYEALYKIFSESVSWGKLNYILVFCAVFVSTEYIYKCFLSNDKQKRAKSNSINSEKYYRKLTEDSLKMAEQEIKAQLDLANSIENLQNENDAIRDQLDEDPGDSAEWGSGTSEEKSVDMLSSAESEEAIIQQELADLEGKKNELETVEQDVNKTVKDFPQGNSINNIIETNHDYRNEKLTNELGNKIKQLEAENEELKLQIGQHRNQNLTLTKGRGTDLDPELLKYLEDHNEELTLDFLEKALETLLEIKASNPDKSFSEYIRDLEVNRSKHTTELTQLMLAKKDADIKYQSLKSSYEEEMTSFNDYRVELVLKNSGAKELLDSLKEKNKINKELIHNLKIDLDSKKKEIDRLRRDLKDMESQCIQYMEAHDKMALEKEQLEAQKRASLDRERRHMLNQSLNRSSASSVVDPQYVPPPQVDMPPVEEFFDENFIANNN